MKRTFIFTVDDNIKFLRDITGGEYESLFDHPYLAMYRRLHEKFGLKVQLNLFYEEGDFDLSMMSNKYRAEWGANADWLKMSFHSRLESEKPYLSSGYDEVYRDCEAVNREILRFAGEASLGKTTTVHWCRATAEGVKALADLDVRGLLGLYGTEDAPRSSYASTLDEDEIIRRGKIAVSGGVAFAGIDVILNKFDADEIAEILSRLFPREIIKVMIHEQYYRKEFFKYQPEFEEKLDKTFTLLVNNGYESCFFEELL